MKKAFSLIEILVVVAIFAILATVASQSTILSLRGARKSDSISDVRGDIDFAITVIERSLRNAQSITSACNGVATQTLTYIDEYENAGSFSCTDLDGDTTMEVASGSARLTSTSLEITSCSFTCTAPASGAPSYIDVVFSGLNKDAEGVDVSPVTVDTRVNLRVY